MTEHEYELAMKMLQAAEFELRHGQVDDAHCTLVEAMRLLSVESGQPDYDYFEMDT